MNFDYDKKAEKMSDWRFENMQELRTKRSFYTQRHFLHTDYITNDFKVPELLYTAEQVEEITNLLKIVCICNTSLFKIEIHQLCKS